MSKHGISNTAGQPHMGPRIGPRIEPRSRGPFSIHPRAMASHLRTALALARKKLLQEAAYGIQFASWFVTPFLSILPYIYQARFLAGPEGRGAEAFSRWAGTTEYVAFIAIGASLWNWVTNLLWEVGFCFRDEQEEGTLEQMWLTPAPRWLLALGNAAANSLVNLIMTLCVLLLVHLFFGLPLVVNWPLLITVAGLSWLAMYGLGFIYAGLVMFFKEAEHLVNLVNDIVLVLAGVTFPLSVLPVWLRGMARLTPLSWILTALRAVLINGSTWHDLRLELTVLSAMAAGFPVLGYLVFTVFETLTRRRGTLGGY